MFSARQLKLLDIFALGEWHTAAGLAKLVSVSALSITRDIEVLLKEGAVERHGKGRATRYRMAPSFRYRYPIDLDVYFASDLNTRQVNTRFNFDIFSILKSRLWTAEEEQLLNNLQKEFLFQKSRLSPTLIGKEWERVTIEFSWKSSAIEGNTYSLLDTENLIKEGIEAEGKTRIETQMILNHKLALDFVRHNAGEFKSLSLGLIETVHSLLVRDLGVTNNLRKTLVGITGTKYQPLDNEFQIKEALEKTCELINQHENIFSKAMSAILLISYIQPFEDGNKRTARLIANAILNAHQSFPLSFRSTNEGHYKKAILVFYEINNISAFKDIFIDQSHFSVKTYFRSSIN